MIETLNDHGRAGVVVPHGVLFGGGEEGICANDIEENLPSTVIGLRVDLFSDRYPGGDIDLRQGRSD